MHASLEGIVPSFQSCLVVQVPSWFNKRWFVLVDGDGNDVGAERFVSAQVTNVAGFLDAVSRSVFGEQLSGAAQFDLEVFGTRVSFNANHLDPLVPATRLADLGSTKDSALVVRMSPRYPKTWFQAIDSHGQLVGSPTPVEVYCSTVAQLRLAILIALSESRLFRTNYSTLELFAGRDGGSGLVSHSLHLKPWIKVGPLGQTPESPVYALLPSQHERWFQLVDNHGEPVSPLTQVNVLGNNVCHFQQALKAKFADIHFTGVPEYSVLLFPNWKEYSDSDRHPLEPSTELGDCGLTKETCLVVQVPSRPSGVGGQSAEAQMEILLSKLEWKDPGPLCSGPGSSWSYQKDDNVAKRLAKPLEAHFSAWQGGDTSANKHSLNVILGAPGTGKTRMLDEMKAMLCEAATMSHNDDLIARMNGASVFRVQLQSSTPSNTNLLLDSTEPGFNISSRMLFQLAKNKDWMTFRAELMVSYPSLSVRRIENVISILAKLKNDIPEKMMTIILCVDGLETLRTSNTGDGDFSSVLGSICDVLNFSKAFVVCVCTATPAEAALFPSSQKKLILQPPSLDGRKVLKPESRFEKELVDDMGGHGRALELLKSALGNYQDLSEVNPISVVEDVCLKIQLGYGLMMGVSVLMDSHQCREIIAAVLSGRQYHSTTDTVGVMTVRELQAIGLFRLTKEFRLECAFFLLLLMMRQLPRVNNEVDNFSDNVTSKVTDWMSFEKFTAFYRRIKSIVYCGHAVPLSTFHYGALFGSVADTSIIESSRRKVAVSVTRVNTQSDSGGNSCNTNHHGLIRFDNCDTIIVNGVSAPAGDVFMRISLEVGGSVVRVNEVIQCKFRETMAVQTQASYDEEMNKAVSPGTDVFLLITTAKSDGQLYLPERCGYVSADQHKRYFGVLLSRALRSFLDIPDLNTASYYELCRVDGVGDRYARKIVDSRPYMNHDEVVTKLRLKRDSKIWKTLRKLLCGGRSENT